MIFVNLLHLGVVHRTVADIREKEVLEKVQKGMKMLEKFLAPQYYETIREEALNGNIVSDIIQNTQAITNVECTDAESINNLPNTEIT